jgi:hypothetical protein
VLARWSVARVLGFLIYLQIQSRSFRKLGDIIFDVEPIAFPSRNIVVPLRPHDRGFPRSFRKLGVMVSDIEPMAFPSRNIGGARNL